MANAIYPAAKASWLNNTLNMTAATLKVVLVDTNGGTPYTYSAAHQFLSDIPAGARVFTSAVLTTPTVTAGVFDADDVSLVSVTGVSAEALVIFNDTGVAGTSKLIAYFDTGVSGLPVTPSGGNISITWDNGANKIFAITG